MARLERVKTGGNGFMARWMYIMMRPGDVVMKADFWVRVSITLLGLSSGWHSGGLPLPVKLNCLLFKRGLNDRIVDCGWNEYGNSR